MIQNNIQVFKFNSNIINLISKDGEIWFIAKEVCEILGISKYRDAILKLDEDEKNICPVRLDGWSQKRNIAVINESGLYALILRSGKPNAKPFRKWITSEVLPSIRKTGSYTVNNSSSIVNDLKSRELQLKRAEYLSKIAERYSNRCDGRYAQILDSYATKELTGEHILPLPERIEHYYTAEEVGKIIGISANKVGRIANLNHMKNEKYGKWFIDKAKYTNKEIEAFRYNQAGIDYIKQLLV